MVALWQRIGFECLGKRIRAAFASALTGPLRQGENSETENLEFDAGKVIATRQRLDGASPWVHDDDSTPRRSDAHAREPSPRRRHGPRQKKRWPRCRL